MPLVFDHDPETGKTEYFDYDPIKEEVRITTQQDVTLFLDRMQALRNDPDISKRGIKEEWWHYCSIPEVVEIELRNRGLRLEDRNHMGEILKIINSEFPYLKATEKWHR